MQFGSESDGDGVHVMQCCGGVLDFAVLRLKRFHLICLSCFSLRSRLQGCVVVVVSVVVWSSLGVVGEFGGDGDGGGQGSAHSSSVRAGLIDAVWSSLEVVGVFGGDGDGGTQGSAHSSSVGV